MKIMKYIKKNLQVVEPEINEDGYYVVGNVAIHPDVFHRQYQPLDFTLMAEEVEDYKKFLEHSTKWNSGATNIDEITLNAKRVETLNRIKQWQDEKQ